MHGDADILRRLWRMALLRRLPLWVLGTLPWLALRLLPGLLAWVAWCMWDAARLRQRVVHGWTGWLDAAVPGMEDSSALFVAAETPLAQLQRRRLLARLDALDAPTVRRALRPHVGAGFTWLLPWLALAAFAWFSGRQPAATAQAAVPRTRAAAAPLVPQLTVTAAPPAYTGAAGGSGAPRDIGVPEGSTVAWCLKNPEAGATSLELSDGRALKVDTKCATLAVTESLFWRWRGARYTIKVTPDAAPTITVTQPAQMVQELKTGATSAAMAISVQDDYRVQRATLHLTLARGSGENIKFTDRELPIPASSNPRLRNWAKTWTLAELGMESGDELYFFVRAADNAVRPHAVQSPTYTLRLPAPAPESEDEEETAAMPVLVKPQSLRSQRQIIIDTEQLIADMRATRMSLDAVRERSEAIALDQGQLRRRYGQFLGEESSLFGGEEHEEHEAEGGKLDVLHQFGHAHDEAENATLYDEGTKKILRRALTAMWEAEKTLRAIQPKTALAPEHKALAAIKELQQADRIYLHKTAFVPPPIREAIRMTGDVVGAASYARAQGGSNEAIPLDLRELVAALSGEGALPALWTRTAHDWVRSRLKDDAQRLSAQRAIQDVLDGCLRCRPDLRAWLRAGVIEAPVLLQAQPVTSTPFTRAWAEGDSK